MIYFITARDVGRVKIGYSAKPFVRFSKIQSDSPSPLAIERVCAGDESAEADLHARFAADRLRGEWFALSAEIEAHMAGLPIPVRERKPRDFRPRTVAIVPFVKSALLTDIENFIAHHAMAESTFGREALGDWRLIPELRGEGRAKPRRLWPETEAKVRAFMATYEAQRAAA